MQGSAKGQAPAEGVNVRWGRGECSHPVPRLLQDFICVGPRSAILWMSELAEKVPKADLLGGGRGGGCGRVSH